MKQFWARHDVRYAAAAVAAGAFGAAMLGTVVWAGLMYWNREFRRRFTDWYKWCLLAGLLVSWLGAYMVAGWLNVPPSWVGLVVMLAAAGVALAGERWGSGRGGGGGIPAHWR